jgi:hypothetical protein
MNVPLPPLRCAAAAALVLLSACADGIPTGAPTAAAPAGPSLAAAGYETQEILPFLAGGYRYLIGAHGHTPGFQATSFDDSAWPVGAAGFGEATFCGVMNTIQTHWPLNTDILLRREFTVPAGATNVRVQAMIDNDVQVWVNGVEVSDGGLLTHEGCAESNLLTPWAVPASVLNPSGTNVVAVRARDRGAVAYIDVRVFADVPVVPVVPPTVTPQVSGTLGNDGWYTSDVAVSFDVNDNGTPVTSTSGCGATAVTSDTHGVSFTCTATSAGGTASGTATLKRDATAPTVAYAGNAGTYSLTQTVSITCSASDATSGVASTTCADVSGAAWSFGVGTHTVSATATDNAGNAGSGSASFQVVATYGGLCELVRQFVANAGVANSLCVKLAAAERAAARGNETARRGALDAFAHEVNAQTGKWVPADKAAVLLGLAAAL